MGSKWAVSACDWLQCCLTVIPVCSLCILYYAVEHSSFVRLLMWNFHNTSIRSVLKPTPNMVGRVSSWVTSHGQGGHFWCHLEVCDPRNIHKRQSWTLYLVYFKFLARLQTGIQTSKVDRRTDLKQYPLKLSGQEQKKCKGNNSPGTTVLLQVSTMLALLSDSFPCQVTYVRSMFTTINKMHLRKQKNVPGLTHAGTYETVSMLKLMIVKQTHRQINMALTMPREWKQKCRGAPAVL